MHVAFLIFGVIVHLVLLYSIFDVYYSSPLVKDAQPHPITRKGVPPASRLVIFSADGLRSSTFFEHPEKSPFLHGIIRNGKGAWGVSKSHVPTESRPGHVAMMAGFYEDVSAVARGWKHNPVPFDSTLNASSKAWLWGSPDIVSLFAETLKPGILQVGDSYSHDEEDFASADASKLDEWVFEKVNTYFQIHSQPHSPIYSNRAIFFLHLLGLDTNGHGNKPRSAKYIDNIHVVDDGVKRTVELFEKTFNFDNRTAYLFTSDHGMTDWGSHGAGTDDEILTPFVAWGAGIRALTMRQVINQVDLAPFQSALLGSAVPVNNLGILPIGLLEVSPKYKFQAAYGNFKQMVEQYSISRSERLRHSLPLMFCEFSGFQFSALARVESEVLRLTTNGRWDAATAVCLEWIPRVRDALLYFHRYQRFSLGLAIVALYISWNVVVYFIVTRKIRWSVQNISAAFLPNRICQFLLAGITLLCWFQALGWSNYLYYLMPAFTTSIAINLSLFENKPMSAKMTFSLLLNNFNDWLKGENYAALIKSGQWFLGVLFIGGTVAGLLLTALVSVFLERRVLSIMYFCMAPLWFMDRNYSGRRPWNFAWYICCLILAIFPMLDTVGGSPLPWLVAVSPLGVIFLLRVYRRFVLPYRRASNAIFVLDLLCGLHFLAFALNGYTLISTNLFRQNRVAWFIQIFSWCTIPLGLGLPLCVKKMYLSDSLVIWLGAAQLPYAMLSISYESLFLLVFSVFLFAFIRLEATHPLTAQPLTNYEFITKPLFSFTQTAKHYSNKLENRLTTIRENGKFKGIYRLHECRRAILLVSMIEMAFFGTGNIASLNSFNTNFLRNFITVFSPFSMAALLVFKISVPFLQLALAFAVILHQNHGEQARLGALLMHITDAMAIVFFHLLKDDGSWLEIGLTISNYVISALSSIIVFVLLHFANHLIQWDFVDSIQSLLLLYLPKTTR